MTDHPQPAATGARAARRPMRLRLAAISTALVAVAATVGVGVAAGPWNDSVVDPGTVNGCQILSSSLNPLSVSGTGASAVVSLAWSIPPNDCRNQTEVRRAPGVCPGGDSASPPSAANAAVFLGASAQVALAPFPGQSTTNAPGAAGTFCYGLVGVHVKAAPNWTGPLSNLRQVVVPPDPNTNLVFRHLNQSGGQFVGAGAFCPIHGQLTAPPATVGSSVTLNVESNSSDGLWLGPTSLQNLGTGTYSITLKRKAAGTHPGGTRTPIAVTLGTCQSPGPGFVSRGGPPLSHTFGQFPGDSSPSSDEVFTYVFTVTTAVPLGSVRRLAVFIEDNGIFSGVDPDTGLPLPVNNADFELVTDGSSFIVGPVN